MTTIRSRHGSAVVTLPSDREILITRAFDAPPPWCSGRGRHPSSSAAGGDSSRPHSSCATSTSESAASGVT